MHIIPLGHPGAGLRRLLVALALLILAPLVAWAQDTTVVLLRHGEKHTRGAFAELNARGLKRAEALVPELEAFHPVALYTSDYKRTQQTLAPLGRKLRLELQVHPRGSETSQAREILREHRGHSVVVCSHSDLIGAWVQAFGLPWTAGEVEGFDGLWIVRIPSNGQATVEFRRQRALRD